VKEQVATCTAKKGKEARTSTQGSLQKVPQLSSLKLTELEVLCQEQLCANGNADPSRTSLAPLIPLTNGHTDQSSLPDVPAKEGRWEPSMLARDVPMPRWPCENKGFELPDVPEIPGKLLRGVSPNDSTVGSNTDHQAQQMSTPLTSPLSSPPPLTRLDRVVGGDKTTHTPAVTVGKSPPVDCWGVQQQALQLSTLLTVRLQQMGDAWVRQCDTQRRAGRNSIDEGEAANSSKQIGNAVDLPPLPRMAESAAEKVPPAPRLSGVQVPLLQSNSSPLPPAAPPPTLNMQVSSHCLA